MKNYLISLLFSISCTFSFSQYIPLHSYYLADYSDIEGKTDIYEISFDDSQANLIYIVSIQYEVHIAYMGSAKVLYAVNKSGNRLQTLNLNSPNPIFSDPVMLDVDMGLITAATFDDNGTLFVGSADQNKIYSIDISDYSIQVYDDYAPVAGGDLAFGYDGGLYLVSQIPTGFYELFPSQISQDYFLGGIPPGSTGLAAFEDGNFLFSHRNETNLEVRSSDNTPLITQFDLVLDGDPFTLHWGDMASGYNPEEFPIPSSVCFYREMYYADYDGASTNIYSVSFEEGAQLSPLSNLDFEAHIATSSNGLIFAVNTNGSQISAIDVGTGNIVGSILLNLNPSHITAVAADGDLVYFGDQISGKIYTIEPMASDPQPVFFANAPLNGGDICFYGSELYLANRSMAKLFKYNGTSFEEVGNLPANVTGIAAFSNFNGTNYEDGLIVSCSGSNIFYSLSPDNGNVLASFQATEGDLPFTLNFGDMASYCNNPQVDMDACTAIQVLNYTEGTTLNGGAISEDRTDPNMALGFPDVEDGSHFVTLGYGGSVILSMGGYIQNGPGDDLQIFETSYNTSGCDDYPEYADVSLSQDGNDWIFIGTVCKTENTLDISDATDLDLFQYVKIDNNNTLTSTPDGFDLNGVETSHTCFPIETGRINSVKATQILNQIEVAPNPGSGRSRLIMIPNRDGNLQADIFDLNGKIVKSLFNKYARAEEKIKIEFNSNSFSNGVYLIRMTTENSSIVEKFIVAH